MTGPTAIPHPETSSHHHRHYGDDDGCAPVSPGHRATAPAGNLKTNATNTNTTSAAANFGRQTGNTSGNGNNSPPYLSPIYTRTAFSLPGGTPISPTSAFRNTATGWAATGVGAGAGSSGGGTNTSAAGLRSPTAVQSHQRVQRDYFPDSTADGNATNPGGRHARAASISSTTSSLESFGPTTPRLSGGDINSASSAFFAFGGGGGVGGHNSNAVGTAPGGGAPLGRVPSIPLATPSSYDKRNSWLSSSTAATGPGSGMTSLFRKLSMGGGGATSGHAMKTSPPLSKSSAQAAEVNARPHQGHEPHPHAHAHAHRSHSVSEIPQSRAAKDAAPGPPPAGDAASAAPAVRRGRQASISGGATKRRPSPHGERLLMGWTHAH